MRLVILLMVIFTIIGVKSSSVSEKFTMIKKNLDKAVELLREVSQEEPAFGKPLARATSTIDTLNKAIENLAAQYKGNGSNPSGGYKPGGNRPGGNRPGYYKPDGFRYSGVKQ